MSRIQFSDLIAKATEAVLTSSSFRKQRKCATLHDVQHGTVDARNCRTSSERSIHSKMCPDSRFGAFSTTALPADQSLALEQTANRPPHGTMTFVWTRSGVHRHQTIVLLGEGAGALHGLKWDAMA